MLPELEGKFNLLTVDGRNLYLDQKLDDREKIAKYFQNQPCFLHVLSPKTGGKTVFTKILQDYFLNIFHHVIIGDLVRQYHSALIENSGEILEFVRQNYNGIVELNSCNEIIKNRNNFAISTVSIPSELILELIKFEIFKHPNKSYILDGFSRNVEQVYISKNLSEILNLHNYRNIFLNINTDTNLIKFKLDRRMICKLCKSPKYYQISPSTIVKFDKDSGNFVMYCDNKNCSGYGVEELVRKEGDEDGFQKISNRIANDNELMKISKKVNFDNSIEVNCLVNAGSETYQEYELIKSTAFVNKNNIVEFKTDKFVLENEQGIKCNVVEMVVLVAEFLNKLLK